MKALPSNVISNPIAQKTAAVDCSGCLQTAIATRGNPPPSTTRRRSSLRKLSEVVKKKLHDAEDLASEKQRGDVQGRCTAPSKAAADLGIGHSFIESASTLLRSYGRSKDLLKGQHLHALLCRYGLDTHTFLSNCIIDMYGNVGCLAEALSTFNAMLVPNLYSFNIMLKVYARHGMPHDARVLFEKIPYPDSYSWTTLINAYGQSGLVEDAMHMFERIPYPDVVSWTAIIAVYSQHRHGREALQLFHQMQIQGVLANNVTFTCMLDACAITKALEEGQNIHAAIFMQSCVIDIALVTSLINMYGKSGSLHDARSCFTKFPYQNVAPWTAMISALAQHGHSMEALHLLYQMQLQGIKPDKITFMCALEACTSMEVTVAGQLVHIYVIDVGFDDDPFIENAIVVMYANCGRLDDAKLVFDRSLHQDVVSWTGMIGAFVQSGQGKEALVLFAQMLLEGVVLDKIVLICVVDACASLQILEKGLEIHIIILNSGYDEDLDVMNALVNMYGKCGSVQQAALLFSKLPSHDIFSWNTLIAAYVQNGEEEEAFSLFYQMQHEGCEPDEITFICILTACSHTGWIDIGKVFFKSLMSEEGMQLGVDHHICMIDLLGRGGLLDEAEYMVSNMSSDRSALAWLCLLGSCKVHNDVERGLRASHHCMELDPENAAVYVLLSNICNITDK